MACGIVEGAYFICTALCLGGAGVSRGDKNMGEEVAIITVLFFICQGFFVMYAQLYQCLYSGR